VIVWRFNEYFSYRIIVQNYSVLFYLMLENVSNEMRRTFVVTATKVSLWLE